MCKEIERKFLINPDYNVYDIVSCKPHDLIGDYYFNSTTRLRVVTDLKNESHQYITIKSKHGLVRDEFEYEIKPVIPPKPLLTKTRYYIPYEGHTFEVNVYDQYFHIPEFVHGKLCLIEVELQDPNESVILPPWVGKEVTAGSYFYNYNLFTFLNNSVV